VAVALGWWGGSGGGGGVVFLLVKYKYQKNTYEILIMVDITVQWR
jgi:uncharacterized membrane-anchored protein YitT (DUF2179 family)